MHRDTAERSDFQIFENFRNSLTFLFLIGFWWFQSQNVGNRMKNADAAINLPECPLFLSAGVNRYISSTIPPPPANQLFSSNAYSPSVIPEYTTQTSLIPLHHLSVCLHSLHSHFLLVDHQTFWSQPVSQRAEICFLGFLSS